MAKLRAFILAGLIILIPLLATVQFLALPVSVRRVQQIFQVDQAPGLSAEEVKKVTLETLRYLSQRDEDRHLIAVYSQRETAHLIDVRARFWQMRIVLIIAVFVALAGIVFGWWQRLNLQPLFGWSTAIVGLVGVMTIFVFPLLFELFHRLFFKPGTYLFYPEDLLIRLFPEEFWWLIAAMLTILVELEIGLAWLVIDRFRRLRQQQPDNLEPV